MSPPIPTEALAHHIAILGKTGSGKSNAAKTVVEELLGRGERVCIVDPTGTWFGLRLTRTGEPSPYPIVIFGGNHADLAIGGAHGAAIAETVGTSTTPAVIDTRLMSVADRTRFFTDFAETLLRKNQGALTLILDEAHLFAPKGKVNDPRSGMMLGAANNLVSLGRGIGLRIILISQRPAKLHNDALGQVETLVAMRMILPHDRAAVMEWVREQADPGQGREIVASLPSMPTGDAWVWSPQLDLLERRHFPLARTFDSGKAPAAGESGPALQPLDLKEVTSRLAKVAADVLANDPKVLKAEIARMKAEAAKRPESVAIAPDPAALKVAEDAAFLRGVEEGERRGSVAGQAVMLARCQGALAGLRVDADAESASQAPVKPVPAARPARPALVQAAAAAPQSRASPAPTHRQSDANGALSGPQRQLLGVLAWWAAMGHTTPSRVQVAAVAGWKITSGHLKNVAGSLKTAGMIDYPAQGLLLLTDEGRAAAPEPDMSIDFHDQLRGTLTGPQQAVFDLLLREGRTMSREEITTALGWAATSGHIKNVVGSMRSLEIVDYPGSGAVALQDWVTA